MKSFIAYPFEMDVLNNAHSTADKLPGKLIAHYELFKKVKQVNGAVVKCGISAEEGFTRFAMFRALVGKREMQKMIAFQKHQPFFEEEIRDNGEVILKVKTRNTEGNNHQLQQILIETGQHNNVDFMPGDISDAIPEYLIENPELKISMLNIDLDDYEGTTNALEFLYPRIVQGGILILDNYFKKMAEYQAVHDYFRNNLPAINHYSVNNGPHYSVKA